MIIVAGIPVPLLSFRATPYAGRFDGACKCIADASQATTEPRALHPSLLSAGHRRIWLWCTESNTPACAAVTHWGGSRHSLLPGSASSLVRRRPLVTSAQFAP